MFDRELDQIFNHGTPEEMAKKTMAEHQLFNSPLDIFGHIDIAMVRDSEQYEYIHTPTSGEHSNIHLGSGFKDISGWRNLEYPQWDADKYIPSEGYDPEYYIEDGMGPEETQWIKQKYIQPSATVQQIASYHTLDHLQPKQVIRTLREIERVLAPGGTFTNIVPHADSQLAKECIWHSSRFMIDTWRNIFSERQYAHDGDWLLEVKLNFIFGLAERNTVLVTQLQKKEA